MADTNITPEVLAKAKVRLVDLTKDWEANQSGVCHGETWKLDGSLGDRGHGACHSWVGYTFRKLAKSKSAGYGWAGANAYDKDAANFLVLNCHSRIRSTASPEATDAILLWMASDECPFSKYIVNRDDKDSLLNGGSIILCGPDGATQAEVMWMCKVLRYGTEGGQSLDAWKTLYERGINPLLAILICTYTSSMKGGKFTSGQVSGHASVFSWNNDIYDVEALTSATINREATDTAQVFKLSKLGDTKRASNVQAKVAGFCKPFKRDDGWGGVITGNAASPDEFAKQALEWQEELGGYVKMSFRPDPLPDSPEEVDVPVVVQAFEVAKPAKPRAVRKAAVKPKAVKPPKDAVFLDGIDL